MTNDKRKVMALKQGHVILLLLALACAVNALSFVPVASLNGSAPGAQEGFAKPMGIALDSSGRLYVADAGADRIVVYSSNLTYLTAKGGASGSGPNELYQPQGVWVDSSGRIYIADTFNHRIQVYTDYTGQFLKTIPTGTGESYSLHRPGGVAVAADGNVHVADTFNNRIQIFSSAGLYADSIRGTEPYGDTVFNQPEAIFIDAPRQRIIVADTGNGRVQVFENNYSLIRRLGWGDGNLGFSGPSAVAVDSFGRIYVADTGNNRVQVFSQDYSFMTSVTGNFSSPSGIAVDALSRLYVSDPVAKRVLVYQIADEELERALAAGKISDAAAGLAAAAASAGEAQREIDLITLSGCTEALEARAYLQASRALAASGNGSLASANAAFAREDYLAAETDAESTLAFAMQALSSARQANASAAMLNAAAQGAIREMAKAKASLAEASALNATALAANITLQDEPALAAARSLADSGAVQCSRGDYADAEATALLAQGNATSAISAMTQEMNVAIIPRYAKLRDRLALAQANVSSYGIPVDLAPIEMQLSVANTLILDSRFGEALAKLEDAEQSIARAETVIAQNTAYSADLRLTLAAGIGNARTALESLRELAANYSQPFADAEILARLADAETGYASDNLTAANASLASVLSLLQSANETITAKAADIESARQALETARQDLASAQAASLPLLSANLDAAHADAASAEQLLYSDPSHAKELAEQASFKARSEAERVNSQKPLYFTVAAVLAVIALILLVLVTGAAAGAYASTRFLRERARRLREQAQKIGGDDDGKEKRHR